MKAIAEATHYQGAKIALLCGADLVTYLRDDFAHIPDPNRWDLPGGVRESHETALHCALRETREEFGIDVPPDMILHAADYTAPDPQREVAFFVAAIPPELVGRIVYGNEGQRWQMQNAAEFIARNDAVPELQHCLSHYFRSVS